MRELWLLTFFVTFIWSGIEPKDTLTWVLEVAPAVIGLVALVFTFNSFRLTTLVYILILGHCILLMVGAHYTYAEVPLFEQLKPIFGFERNNFDKLGHFVQGFVPAIIAREVLIRKQVVTSAAWRNFIIVNFCLAFSALYEVIEWLVAIVVGGTSEAFLGTQGYVWDTQSDMALALVGSIIALLSLSRFHDVQLRKLTS